MFRETIRSSSPDTTLPRSLPREFRPHQAHRFFPPLPVLPWVAWCAVSSTGTRKPVALTRQCMTVSSRGEARWDILLPPPHACLFFQQPTASRDEILLCCCCFFWHTGDSIRADNDTKPVVVVACTTQEQNEKLVSDDYRKLRKRVKGRGDIDHVRICGACVCSPSPLSQTPPQERRENSGTTG